MALERIRADLVAAAAADDHHRSKVLRFVLTLIDDEAERNHRSEPTEQDAQSALRRALTAAEEQEGRMEIANRLAAAEISERDVLMLAGYLDDQV